MRRTLAKAVSRARFSVAGFAFATFPIRNDFCAAQTLYYQRPGLSSSALSGRHARFRREAAGAAQIVANRFGVRTRSRYRALFKRPLYVTRWRRTGWLGRRDSILRISEADSRTEIPR